MSILVQACVYTPGHLQAVYLRVGLLVIRCAKQSQIVFRSDCGNIHSLWYGGGFQLSRILADIRQTV